MRKASSVRQSRWSKVHRFGGAYFTVCLVALALRGDPIVRDYERMQTEIYAFVEVHDELPRTEELSARARRILDGPNGVTYSKTHGLERTHPDGEKRETLWSFLTIGVVPPEKRRGLRKFGEVPWMLRYNAALRNGAEPDEIAHLVPEESRPWPGRREK